MYTALSAMRLFSVPRARRATAAPARFAPMGVADRGALEIEVIPLALREDLVPLVARWTRRSWRVADRPATLEEVRAELARHVRDAGIPTTFVALDAGQPVGAASLIEHDARCGGDVGRGPWIGALHVVPALRGTGVGARLANAAARRAGALGHRAIYLCAQGAAERRTGLDWSVVGRCANGDTILEKLAGWGS